LQDVITSNGSHLNIGETFISEDTTVCLFTSIPDDVKKMSTNSTLLLHGLPSYKIIPPLRGSGEVVCQCTGVFIVPNLNLVPNRGGKWAVLAKVDNNFQRWKAEAANGVVRPSPDGQHISSEELSV
jgi:hypothetical protein